MLDILITLVALLHLRLDVISLKLAPFTMYASTMLLVPRCAIGPKHLSSSKRVTLLLSPKLLVLSHPQQRQVAKRGGRVSNMIRNKRREVTIVIGIASVFTVAWLVS